MTNNDRRARAMRRRTWAWAALPGLSLALALGTGANAGAAPTPGVSADQILIGQTLSLEGGKNDHGVASRQGVEAAVRQVNASGGVWGRKLVLQVMDDQGKPATAEANARKLMADGVFLLFGSIEGGPSTAVMTAAVDKGVPFFGPMAGSPTLRRPFQPLVFPVRAEHREEFRTLMAHAHSLGMRRVAFLRSDSEVGRQHLENVLNAANANGMAEVVSMAVGGTVSDAQIEQFVQQLRDKKIEVMFNHGSIGVYERLIRRARGQGLKTVFYAVNSGSAQMAKHLGPLAYGMVFTQVVPSPWERKSALTREYQTAFKAAYPEQPLSYGSLEGYVTLRVLAEALRKAGRDLNRTGFQQALTDAQFDIAGYKLRYTAKEHVGSTYVDTAIVTADGSFRH